MFKLVVLVEHFIAKKKLNNFDYSFNVKGGFWFVFNEGWL